jgi:4-hydroxybenzoate polyprenyltransferase
MKYIQIMRPSHWTKNVFVFAAVIFGEKFIGPLEEVVSAATVAIGAFFCFCLASSAIYIFNDIIDRDSDKQHPEKSKRPIASGQITIGAAVLLSVLCGLIAIAVGYFLSEIFSVVILVYIALMILYSLLFKKMMILDCVVIAIGFCLRAIGGAVVVGVPISSWLIICTFALCLFLGFGKRRSEIAQLGEDSEAFRRTLAGYTPELLAHMLDVTSGLAIVCFLLYATDDRTIEVFGTNSLVYTTPFVLYCIFRFSALIQKGKYLGPVELILHDRPFQIGIFLWALACIGIIYFAKFNSGLC